MTEKTYPMKLNEDYYICLANDLILGRQKTMSIWANRLLNFLIMQLVVEDTEFKTHTVRVQELADFIGMKNNGKLYEDIKKAVKEILENIVEIHKGKAWEMFHWVSHATYDGNGQLTLSLSDEVKPYLLDLKTRGWFTQFQFKELLPMTSYYAIRLYQYITLKDKLSRENLGHIEITIQQLREYLECTDKHQRISDFKKKVIEVAVNQINNNPNSEYWLDVEYIKTGKTVTHVKFYLHYGKAVRLALNGADADE